jgi:hypothetical protein
MVHETITPSGFSICFEDGLPDPETGKSKKRSYLVNDEKLPSVTTIIGMLDKPGLIWWSEKLATEGCIALAQDGGLPTDVDGALGQLTRRKLRHFQVSEQKAARGNLSHQDFVHLAAGRELPPLDAYSEDQRGFVQGVAAFLADYRPTIVQSELMVASLRHRYAGRLDLHATLGITTQPNGMPAPRGLGQIDLKTHDKLPRTKPSKANPEGRIKTPYPEALIQVGLYEVASRECGYDPTAWQGIVRVDAQGNYDFTVSWLGPETALALLPAYDLFRSVGARVKTEGDMLPVGLGEPAA